MTGTGAVDMDGKLFAEDDVEPIRREVSNSPWKVLVVDDEEDVLAVTRLVFGSFRFEDRKVQLLSARSGAEARDLLQSNKDVAVAFIDVVMETDSAGLDLVRFIREELHNDEVQVVLRTGQPGYAPEMKVILEYGINDYRTKTELDNVKLLSCLVSGLRNYENIVHAREAVSQQAITEELNRAKSLFFAQMSHDLRTPLNSIQGFCQLLQMSKLDAEQREHVRMIRESGHHLLALVNDILDLSKAEAGKIRLEAIPFSLHDLVMDTVAFLQPQVSEEVRFDTVIAGSVPNLLLGDPVRVRQILYNLLSNALKFTRRGSVKLTLNGQPHTEKAGCHRIVLTVADTGMGISPEHLENLFSVYEQGDVSVNRSHGGTGLGLHICKQLTELMHGSINVTSHLGQGSTFTVTLELPAAEVDEPTPPTRLEAVPIPVMTGFARILVVDDDASNRLILRKFLERRGYEIRCTASGDEALQLAAKTHFDLLLMDCQMPGLSGEETTRQLRQIAGYSRVPVIALTGNAEDSKAECFKAGMNDFMTKPIEKDALYGMVAKWLGLRTMMK